MSRFWGARCPNPPKLPHSKPRLRLLPSCHLYFRLCLRSHRFPKPNPASGNFPRPSWRSAQAHFGKEIFPFDLMVHNIVPHHDHDCATERKTDEKERFPKQFSHGKRRMRAGIKINQSTKNDPTVTTRRSCPNSFLKKLRKKDGNTTNVSNIIANKMRNHPTARKTKKPWSVLNSFGLYGLIKSGTFSPTGYKGGACSRVIPDSVALAFVFILEDRIIKPVVLKRVFGLLFPIPDDDCLHAHKIPFVISFRAQRPAYKSDPRYNKKNGKEDRYSVQFFLFQSPPR